MTLEERRRTDHLLNVSALADDIVTLAFTRAESTDAAVYALCVATASALHKACPTRAAAECRVMEILRLWERIEAVRARD